MKKIALLVLAFLALAAPAAASAGKPMTATLTAAQTGTVACPSWNTTGGSFTCPVYTISGTAPRPNTAYEIAVYSGWGWCGGVADYDVVSDSAAHVSVSYTVCGSGPYQAFLYSDGYKKQFAVATWNTP